MVVTSVAVFTTYLPTTRHYLHAPPHLEKQIKFMRNLLENLYEKTKGM
jgi:hypothetical protein